MVMRSAVMISNTRCRSVVESVRSPATIARNDVSGGTAICEWLSSITANSDVPERGQPTTTGNGLAGAGPGANAPGRLAVADAPTRSVSGADSKTSLPAIRSRLDELDRHSSGLSAADTQTGDATLFSILAQRAKQRHHDARTGGSDRMTKRTGATMHVDLFGW